MNFISGGRSINGIIYLHRISDPRVGGAAKKNLRLFRELCGDDMLRNVRLVTTNWDSVGEKEGNSREAELASRIFKPLIDAGAKMVRHDRGPISAQSIMSTLVHQESATMKIQGELDAGIALGDTSAGAVIVEEMKELKRKHDEEMQDLLKELQEATMANDEDLRAEIAEERRKLEELMTRAEQDEKRLTTLAYAPQGLPRETPPLTPSKVSPKTPPEIQPSSIPLHDAKGHHKGINTRAIKRFFRFDFGRSSKTSKHSTDRSLTPSVSKHAS